MNTTAEEQEPKSKGKWHGYLIMIIALLCLYIVVNVFLIILVLGRRQPAEPKEMVLLDFSGDTIIGGSTKEDLEEAVKLATRWLKSASQGNPEEGLEQIDDLGYLIASGHIIDISSGTDCLLIESHPSMCKVQITEGMENGKTYWVYRKFVKYAKQKEYSARYAVTLICFRYFITAALSCVGIYFLRINSILFQIVCFILGMIVLNLLWARIAIAMFLTF